VIFKKIKKIKRWGCSLICCPEEKLMLTLRNIGNIRSGLILLLRTPIPNGKKKKKNGLECQANRSSQVGRELGLLGRAAQGGGRRERKVVTNLRTTGKISTGVPE
jgi:hypothetical protein